MKAIEVDRLTKKFRQVGTYRDLALYALRRATHTAVDEISLSIADGELFGLLGENGAGKTTLIRMLSTTLLPTAGTALVGGHDVEREPQNVRRLIGLVNGDERSFYWRLTGRQNLDFFAALYHVSPDQAKSRIAKIVDTLGVAKYLDHRFDTYSTGTRQKFAIARGLLNEPRILFLDEPTRALDPIAADDLRRYIVDEVVGRNGCTVLLATHSLAEAEAICDRVAIVRHGKLVSLGTVQELRAQTGLAPVVDLEVATGNGDVNGTISSLPGLNDVTITPNGETTRIVARLGPDGEAMNRLMQAILASGVRIETCVTRHATLEDVYRWAHAPETSS